MTPEDIRKDREAGTEGLIKDRSDWLVDAVAMATQNRQFLRGEPECDEVACDAIRMNGEKAMSVIAKPLNDTIAAQAAEIERLREALDCGEMADMLMGCDAHKVVLTTVGRYGWVDGLATESGIPVAHLDLEDSQYGPRLWDYAISVLKARAALAELKGTE